MEGEVCYESDGGESLDLFADEEEEDLESCEAFDQPEGRHVYDNKEEQTKHPQTGDSKSKSSAAGQDETVPQTNQLPTTQDPDDLRCKRTQQEGAKPLSPGVPICRIGLNDHKAGMEGLDREKINQIILEASKGSNFYENEVRKEKQVTTKINHMLEEMRRVTPAQRQAALEAADREIELLEASRDLSHIVVHIDMDAFYAAVEMRDNPKLKDVPMAVGSNSMLSTSNYAARRYGVRAAMPGFIGRKLCPDLVIVKPNYGKYCQVSDKVRQILAEYDPDFCPIGLDESYLDLTEYIACKLSAQESSDSEIPPPEDSNVPNIPHEKIIPGNKSELTPAHHDHKQLPGLRNGDAVKPELSRDAESSVRLEDYTSDTQSESALQKLSTHTQTARSSRRHPPPPTALSPTKLWDNDAPGSDPARLQLPRSHWEIAQTVVEEIRARVYQKTGLTASAGIAPNKMLAKVTSDINKPNGQYFLTPTRDAVLEFVQKLPIRKISGIGKVTERMLNALGVTTCRDLYEQRAILQLLFSNTSSHSFLRICLGISSADVHKDYEQKSMSTERTFAELSDPGDLQKKCYELCQSLAEDMEDKGLKGRTVTLKLKTVFFEVKSRGATLPRPVSTAEELYHSARELLGAEIKACLPAPLRLRLMGVRVSSLQAEAREKQETLEGFLQSGKQVQTASAAGVQSEATPALVVCPVCGHKVPADNTVFNQHIDECLNQSALEEATSIGRSMDTVIPSPSKAGLGRSMGIAIPSPSKAGPGRSQGRTKSDPCKRKRPYMELHTQTKKKRTLDYFWK